jgi:hypothetical protein
VKALLQSSGFAEIWLFPESVSINVFIPLLTNRLRDLYIAQWQTGIEQYSSLSLYRIFKKDFSRAKYLDIIGKRSIRNKIAKLRLSSHNLMIESGRHRRIERSNRKCELCNLNDIEDEYHFVIICPYFKRIRDNYIDTRYLERPNVFKFTDLLNSSDKQILFNLGLFCKNAFQERNTFMSRQNS